MQDWAAVWKQATENRSLVSFSVTEPSPEQAVITAEYAFANGAGDEVARWTSTYNVFGSGAISVENRFERGADLPVVPRVGMNVELSRDLDQVEWFGRGPFENYSDRHTAANVGRYSNTVADHYVPYGRPQENGYKTDVRWLSLSDTTGAGLLVIAEDLMSFGVQHNRLTDFVPPFKIAITSEDGPGAQNNDARVNVHVNDVVPRDLVSLDVDLGQMGVGGDDSWGKRTLLQYSFSDTAYSYKFTLVPYTLGADGLDQLVSR